MPKYMLSIVESEAAYAEAGAAEFDASHEGAQRLRPERSRTPERPIVSGEALQPTSTATYLRGTQDRRRLGDRQSAARGQGSDRRLLPDRRRRRRGGPRAGQAVSGAATVTSNCARSGNSADHPGRRRGRGRRGAGSAGAFRPGPRRDAAVRPRPRHRRGVDRGCLSVGAAELADHRHTRFGRSLAGDSGQTSGRRSDSPGPGGQALVDQACGRLVRSHRRGRCRDRGGAGRRRRAPDGGAVLRPAPDQAGSGRADAAAGLRRIDGRHRGRARPPDADHGGPADQSQSEAGQCRSDAGPAR